MCSFQSARPLFSRIRPAFLLHPPYRCSTLFYFITVDTSLSSYCRVTSKTSHRHTQRHDCSRENMIHTYVSGICKFQNQKTKKPKFNQRGEVWKQCKESCSGACPRGGGETGSQSTCRRSMWVVPRGWLELLSECCLVQALMVDADRCSGGSLPACRSSQIYWRVQE